MRALAVVLWRHFTRRAVKAGANPSHGRVPTFLLLSIVWAVYLGHALWPLLSAPAALGPQREVSVGWQLDATLLLLVSFGLGELAPELGRLRSPLRAALLDELPVTAAARVVLAWACKPFGIGLPVLAFLAWVPEARATHAGLAWLMACALGLYLAAVSTGIALATWARVLAPVSWRRTLAGSGIVLMLAALPVLVAAPLLVAHSPGPLALALTRAILTGGGAALPLVLALWLLGALALIGLGELRGYDRLDAAPSGKRRARDRGALTLERVERRLVWREGGLQQLILMLVLLGGFVVASVFLMIGTPKPALLKGVGFGYALMLTYTGALIALAQGGSSARRDAAARPLLSPLPISPYETLAGKVRAVRLLMLPLLVTAIPALLVALRHGPTVGWDAAGTIVWRVCAALVGSWLAADAAVSIAFLTNGVGLPGQKTLGAPTSYASQLLLLPLLAAATAPNALVALASTATTGAVAFEARRAAQKCVRWLDDAADDLDRETTVWRALLCLAVFYAVQALGAQLFHSAGVSPAGTLALTYGAGAVALVVLTLQGRRGLERLRLWPQKPGALAAGLLGGALSAGAALAFADLLHGLVADAEVDLGGSRAWLFGAMAVAAPVAEELFFRGWLQDAIRADLAPSRKRWAFVIAALAFSCAHVGTYLVPQAILGLIAGALYAWSGGLLPGILAHAVHNGLVLLLSG